MSWKAERFTLAMLGASQDVDGWTYKGLGLAESPARDRYGRRRWSVTHLASGHALCNVAGADDFVQRIVGALADVGCFADYSMPGGWANIDPDLPKKFHAWLDRHRDVAWQDGAGIPHNDEAQARAIAASRE